VSIAITPPAANAAAPAPVAELKLSPITYPNTAVSAQASTTAPHIKPVFAIDHPWLASSELGANPWGTFETQTAATNAMLIVGIAGCHGNPNDLRFRHAIDDGPDNDAERASRIVATGTALHQPIRDDEHCRPGE
jgi:hypothetical protein